MDPGGDRVVGGVYLRSLEGRNITGGAGRHACHRHALCKTLKSSGLDCRFTWSSSTREKESAMEGYGETRSWPVVWSAVWVGALAALAIGLVIGLLGFAVGAHEVSRAVAFKNIRFTTLAFSIAGAFFSAVIGGWVAARIAGFRRAEWAMLHGAIVWL